MIRGLLEKTVREVWLGTILFAFALCAAMGMLTMRAVVDKLDDPLIHSDEDLVEELCNTFRAAAAENARRS